VTIKDKYAFVGVGLTKQGHVPEYDYNELATQAILQALEDAGMKKQDLDGYIYQPGFDGGPTKIAPVQAAGIPVKFSWEIQNGGCSAIMAIANAIGALEAGLCKACVTVYATSAASRKIFVGETNEAVDIAATYGYFAPMAPAATMTNRYRHLYGLTEKQLGTLAVTLRDYANKRPEAVMYNKKLTMDEYLKSRFVIEPVRARDCCLVNDGAVALIITSADRAKNSRKRPVYIMGIGVDHSFRDTGRSPGGVWHLDGFVTEEAKKTAFKTAGITVKDIDVAQLYDAFTIFVVSQLESYGICGRGEAGAYIEDGNLGLQGPLPCNTSGTLHSWSYLQGFTHLYEGIKQMRGEAGECQVKDAELCLATGLGASGMIGGSAAGCCILRR
jgi:acetyl-CoA acetyltransferase